MVLTRSRAVSAPDRQGLLPTIETSGASEEAVLPPSENFTGNPVYRRHHRKRSSTVLIPPRTPILTRERSRSRPSSFALEIDNLSSDQPVAVVPTAIAKGAGALAGAQVLAKVLTFLLNQALLRLVGARDLGASAKLEFIGQSVLSFAREAVRLAAQRQSLDGKSVDEYRPDGGPVHGTVAGTLQETVNLGYVPLIVGAPLAVALAAFAWFDTPLARAVAAIYALAVIVELLSEPFFLIVQIQMKFSERARVESAGITLRCLSTFGLVVAGAPAILAYAAGQLAYSCALVFGYYLQMLSDLRAVSISLLPQRVWASDSRRWFVDPRAAALTLGLSMQAIFKYLLSEMDQLITSLVSTLEEQGEYALAANYGSLIARTVLFPMEEALRGYFSRLLAQPAVQVSSPGQRILGLNGSSGTVSVHTPIGVHSVSLPPTPIFAYDQTFESEKSPINFQPRQIVTGSFSASPVPSPVRSREASFKSQALSLDPDKAPLTIGTASTPPYSAKSSSSLGIRSIKSTEQSLWPQTSSSVNKSHASKESAAAAANALATVLRCYVYISFFAVAFGPPAAEFVLRVLASDSWAKTRAPVVLAAYAMYIPFLAWNGALEAFVQSIASLADLRRQGVFMFVVAVIFVGGTILLMRILQLGAEGLVYAQIVSMTLRIIWSLRYAIAYFREAEVGEWLNEAIPPRLVFAAAAASFAAAHARGRVRSVTHLMQFLTMALMLACTIIWCERDNVRVILNRSNNESELKSADEEEKAEGKGKEEDEEKEKNEKLAEPAPN